MRKVTWSLAMVFAVAISFLVVGKTIAGDTYDEFDRLDDVGIYMLVQDLDHHFDEARIAFEEKDMHGAAQEIRMAIGFLRIEAGHATGDEQAALNTSIEELNKLADDVEDGRVTSVKTLHDAFGKAQLALSMNSWVKAVDAFKQKDFEKASHHLKTSQGHLERAIAWSSHNKPKKAEESQKK